MTSTPLKQTLRQFRRQVLILRTLRWAAMLALLIAFLGAALVTSDSARHAATVLGVGALMVWMALLVNSARVTREVQAGSLLASTGQYADAEVWLRRAILRSSLSLYAKFLGASELATLMFRKEQFADTVEICMELLRQPISRVRALFVSVRLLLADSLLHLNRVNEAYEAMRPVYQIDLSLHDRMRLLPIQLRYELAADHAASALKDLRERLKIAELLEGPQAALVHALLAEACRRENKPTEQAYLTQRAWLYHDLDKLVQRYQIIAPIATNAGQSSAV